MKLYNFQNRLNLAAPIVIRVHKFSKKTSEGAQKVLIQQKFHSTILISANFQFQDVPSHISLQNEGGLPVRGDHAVQGAGGGQSPAPKQGIRT